MKGRPAKLCRKFLPIAFAVGCLEEDSDQRFSSGTMRPRSADIYIVGFFSHVAVVLLILAAPGCCNQPSLKIVETGNVTVYEGKDEVAIPCLVQATGLTSGRTPFVSWFRLKNNWSPTDEDAYDNIHDIRKYSYPDNVACVYQELQQYNYDCSLRWGPIRRDDNKSHYKCVVTHPDTRETVDEETSVNVIFKKQNDVFVCPESSSWTLCIVPEVDNVRVSYSAPSLSVTWDEVDPQVLRVNCTQDRFCPGSQNWTVRLFQSNSVYRKGDPTSVSITRGVFNATFVVRLDRYYHFEVFNTRQDITDPDFFQNLSSKQLGDYTSPFVSSRASSEVQYYGEQAPANLVTEAAHVTVAVGEKYKLKCAATGTPTPYVFVSRIISGDRQDDAPADTRTSFTIESAGSGDTGLYLCSAVNTLVPPAVQRMTTYRDFREIHVEVIVAPVVQTSGQCDLYTGNECTGLISNIKVFVNVTEGGALQHKQLARNITRRIDDQLVQSSLLQQDCLRFAKSLACHALYPYCGTDDQSPRPICFEACHVLTEGACAGIITREEHGQLYDLLQASCEQRPKQAGTAPECSPVDLPNTKAVRHSLHCVVGDGRGYRGDKSRTHSGSQCQTWSAEEPHEHPLTTHEFGDDLTGAGHSCRNPGGLGARPWCYTSNPDVRWEYCDIPACACEPYKGHFCTNVTGVFDQSVHVDTGLAEDGQDELERSIIGAYHQFTVPESLSPGCEHALRALLCQAALPTCHASSEGHAQRFCSGHCLLLEELGLCPDLRHSLVSFLEKSQLPVPTCPGPPQEDDCLPTPKSLGPAADSPKTDLCYSGVGQGYVGMVAETVSGAPCQRWDGDHLPPYHISPDLFPELARAENFCRNPGQLGLRPWCFTSNASLVWEYCDVALCPSVQGPNPIASPAPVSPGVTTDHTVVVSLSIFFPILVAFGIVAVVGLLLIFRIRCRQLKGQDEEDGLEKPSLARCTRSGSVEVKLLHNPQYVTHTMLPAKTAELVTKFPRVDRDKIKYVKQLGQGNFGVVFQGRAEDLLGEGDKMVAVKTLKEETSSEALEDFIHEAKLMFSFDHPNIVKIYGVCMTTLPFYMVFEFMEKGDLTKFLRENASSFHRRYLNPMSVRSRTESTLSNEPPSLSSAQLLDICSQVAAGMEYLASNKHVHRDLACRNCLVTSGADGITIKIGDFGMSHNLYSRDYYRVNGTAILPVRWMSPEAVIYGKFSTAGDVWSFGVVMWEIFSFAMQPYCGTSNEEVTEAIRRGRLLKIPIDCPIKVYELMKTCWSMDPGLRPSFSDLHSMLRSLHLSESSLERSPSDDRLSQAGSDISSDAFYEENSVDGLSVEITA